MYVDDCPSCGCPVITDEPGLADTLLVAVPSCPDISCACHGREQHPATRPVEL